jgi:hypothetical protein
VQRNFFLEETNGPKLPFFKENKIEIAIFRPQVLAFVTCLFIYFPHISRSFFSIIVLIFYSNSFSICIVMSKIHKKSLKLEI